ncbi:hypothetical protein JCGZ_20987 [Jatropha curcas]|uniref:Rad21/Rec8-like protein N-terminal domain-containing protein n=1 Tax=Jatropha curcas TaxID=180498 RepID=A0A067JT31_JATCU|nr:hypothetical protein JCGZ_20987 [Jatropha curcas]
MFYSQTFLARKGPLGTVWCAAHLKHRLKKSHYTSTDVSSTVDCIMFPEVPIALRMAGHLLLGVVRIYSKKVHYLYHDCYVFLNGLRKAFASIEVNLPENATTAQFESVTLPQTFDLDALNVEFDTYPDGCSVIAFYTAGGVPVQDIMMDVLPSEHDTDAGIRSMEEEILAPLEDMGAPLASPINLMEVPTGILDLPSTQTTVPMDTVEIQDLGPNNQTELQTGSPDLRDPGPSNQTEVINSMLNNDNSPPEIEIMRDPVHGFSPEKLPSGFPYHQNDVFEPTTSFDQGLNEKEIPSPFKEDALPSRGQPSPFQRHSEAPENFITDISFGNRSPELAIRSTPPVQQPRPRQRKRKHFFDESTVLTNKRRKEIPSTALGIWKLNKNLRREQVLYEPSLTGYSANICNLFKRDYIITKSHLTLEREATPEPRVVTSPAPSTEAIAEARDANSPAPATEVVIEDRDVASPAPITEEIPEPTVAQSPASEAEPDLEIERLRHHEGQDGNRLLPDSPARFIPSPGRFVSSPFRRDDFTPNTQKNLGSGSVPWAQTSIETEVMPTPGISASPGTCTTEPETPRTFLEDQFDLGHTGLSDIPESIAETEDLYFLEADNTPAGSQGTQSIDSLSVRSRAVAQYLKRHSLSTPLSGDQSRDLSLNKILQGKTRKLCARMFFETLVLKSYGLVDVGQEQPYGDIVLKLTSTLTKAQI